MAGLNVKATLAALLTAPLLTGLAVPAMADDGALKVRNPPLQRDADEQLIQYRSFNAPIGKGTDRQGTMAYSEWWSAYRMIDGDYLVGVIEVSLNLENPTMNSWNHLEDFSIELKHDRRNCVPTYASPVANGQGYSISATVEGKKGEAPTFGLSGGTMIMIDGVTIKRIQRTARKAVWHADISDGSNTAADGIAGVLFIAEWRCTRDAAINHADLDGGGGFQVDDWWFDTDYKFKGKGWVRSGDIMNNFDSDFHPSCKVRRERCIRTADGDTPKVDTGQQEDPPATKTEPSQTDPEPADSGTKQDSTRPVQVAPRPGRDEIDIDGLISIRRSIPRPSAAPRPGGGGKPASNPAPIEEELDGYIRKAGENAAIPASQDEPAVFYQQPQAGEGMVFEKPAPSQPVSDDRVALGTGPQLLPELPVEDERPEQVLSITPMAIAQPGYRPVSGTMTGVAGPQITGFDPADDTGKTPGVTLQD